MLEELEWHPIEMQCSELRIQLLFNEVTLEKCHMIEYAFHHIELENLKYVHIYIDIPYSS